MERICFDTSVLVPAVVDQLPAHVRANDRLKHERDRGAELCCSTHTLAECFSVMTALPLPKRISSQEASSIIQANFLSQFLVTDLSVEDYAKAITLCAERSRISGQIYDALHVISACKVGCETLYTYNINHFKPLAMGTLQIAMP